MDEYVDDYGAKMSSRHEQGKAKAETIGRVKMSSRQEQGKAKAETIGRAKMSSRQEQEKARTTNISGKRNHGKVIKTRAPGTARDAGATGTGGAAGAAGAASSGFMPVLVVTLSQPMLYFRKRQRKVIIRCGLSALDSYADYLPGWIPAYIVGGALGFNAKGIDRAVADLQGISPHIHQVPQ